MNFYENYVNPDLYQKEHPDAHLILQNGNKHYIVKMSSIMHGTMYPRWMCWQNKDVAEFAARQFTNLYSSVN